jgi:hypothetical protein
VSEADVKVNIQELEQRGLLRIKDEELEYA